MAGSAEYDFGSDSFLDVITNFVGILIILVMVVGERAKNYTAALAAKANSELEALRAEEASVDGEVRRIAAQMQTVNRELRARFAERAEISALITAAEGRLAERRAGLGGDKRGQYDAARDLALANDELARLNAEREQTERTAQTPETVKVENYPTPLSKTVDGREVHFQLSGGRLTFVPFDALVNQLRDVMRERMSHMNDMETYTDTVGPIGGFRMRYFLERVDTPRGNFIQVHKVEMVPLTSQLGEPLDAALAPRSKFRSELEMISPRQYTITVWTYPDSFAEFRRLKKELYLMGYAVAARPLLEGMPIGASPRGSRSSAE